MKFLLGLVVFFGTSIALTGTSNADLVRYTVSGTIDGSSDAHTPSFVGGLFTMQFEIDLDTLVDGIGGADKGNYQGQIAGTFSIVSGLNSYAGTLVNGGAAEIFEINNKNGGDEIELDYDFAGSNINFGGDNLAPNGIQIHLKGPGTTFDSDVPDPSLSGTWWDDVVNAKIEFGTNKDLVLGIQSFTAEGITAVPEPTALSFLSIVGLGALLRRRK